MHDGEPVPSMIASPADSGYASSRMSVIQVSASYAFASPPPTVPFVTGVGPAI